MRQIVFTIAPHADFLGVLAERLIDGTLAPDEDRKNPFWLADCTVFLPTRRARQALAEALMARGQFMLPDIRTLGGETGEEDAFLPPFEEIPAPLPVSPVERQLRLSRLVAAWAGTEDGKAAFSIPPGAAEILALAASLGELQDEFVTARANAGRLQSLIAIEQLAGQWQQTLKFVSIALEYWPGVLALEGKADRTSLQNRRLERLAQAVPVLFGERPVIVAGSTGSVPASADLIAAIAKLKRGSIVLPGLDTGLAEDELDRLADPATGEHGHPQFGLVQLLARLGTRPDAVAELAERVKNTRTDFVRLALATTDGTAAWRRKRPGDAEIAAALAKVSVIAARTEDEEARAVALAARAALGEGKRVGIVTPDRNLGRRIGAELKRFGVVVDDPAGQPLFQSPAGRLVRQVLGLVESECAPTDVVALLRAPGLDLGPEQDERLALVDRLDMRLLRGRRHAPGLAGLRAGLEQAREDDVAAADALLGRLESGIAPLVRLRAEARVSPAQFAAALAESFSRLAREDAGSKGRAELEALLGEIARLPEEGVPFAPRRLADAFAALSAGHEVRNLAPRRQDIAIWGRLEARLQSRTS
jgi:ATP-dependent helicase/nuclease subunit B